MDDANQGLEGCLEPLFHFIRRQNAGLLKMKKSTPIYTKFFTGPQFALIDSAAKRLDRFYISARYPNGLPGLSPFQAYSKDDSDDAWRDLNAIFTVCRQFLFQALAPSGTSKPPRRTPTKGGHPQ